MKRANLRHLFAAGHILPNRRPERVPPSYDPVELMANHLLICTPRGFHGPFVNERLYDWFGGIWRGFADCELCFSTVKVQPQLAAKADAERGAA